MQITEKNIFNYVFFKETLRYEKILEIEGDNNIQSQISFYVELKEQLTQEISENIREKLSEHIKVYDFNTIISLRPINVNNDTTGIRLIKYAAASENNETEPVITYANESKNYLIRLHKTGGKYKIYVFSTLQEKLGNMQLTFYPSKEIVSLKDNENSFSISLSDIPEKIDMKFN